MVIKKFNQSELAQKNHASITWCQMHANQFWWLYLLRFQRYCYLQKRPNFPFRPWTIVHGHQKIQSIGISSKKSCKCNLMSNACTPILVGGAILVSEILPPSKTAKFPFLTMDYSPWSSKILIDWNQPKKNHASLTQCQMHTHQFWWVWPFWFRRYCYFQKRPNFPFWPWTIVHGHQKIQSIGISSKKSCKYNLMSNACIPILVGGAILVLEILLPSKTAKSPFLTIVIKKFNQPESAQKNYASITWCQMHAHQFWWVWPFWFWRYCHLQKRPNFPFWPWTIAMVIKKLNRLKSAQKNHASITWCQMHTHQFWWSWSFWFRRYCYFQKRPNFPFWPWTIVHGHQKIQSIEIDSKKSCKFNLMSNACTPILVGVAILVSEILLPSKTAKFPFPTMDYNPWSSKNSIDRNQLKKIMQV